MRLAATIGLYWLNVFLRPIAAISEAPKPPSYIGIGPFGDMQADAISVPDFFDVDLGGNTLRFSRSTLAKQVPIVGETDKQPCQFSIGFNSHSELIVNATLYDLNGHVVAVVKDNKFDKQDTGLGINWDNYGFEIVDDLNKDVQLQVDHRTRSIIRIRGLFVISPNRIYAVTDEGVTTQTESMEELNRYKKDLKRGKKLRQMEILSIFRYPSSKFLHVRAEYH
jgi:hypothetical protein